MYLRLRQSGATAHSALIYKNIGAQISRPIVVEARVRGKGFWKNWWARLDLNQGPIPYEGTALTAELRAPETSEQSERVSLFYSFPFIIAKSVRAHNLFPKVYLDCPGFKRTKTKAAIMRY